VSTAAPAPHPPLTGSARLLGTLVLSAATFMNVLDTSIANVSLPAIAGNLGVSLITSYAVANAISVPLTGWLTQRLGQVRLFVACVLLFVLTSWLCGLAPDMTVLIAFRVLQGFAAGPMIALSQTLLLSSYPREKAGMAMAMWSMTILIAPITGPLLGGWITDHISWRWIFFINVPVGLLAALGTWAIYRERETPIRRLPIDAVGLALLVTWVGALQLMLDKGKELDWFASPQIVAFAVVAVVGFAFFMAWELTEEHPVVDLTLFIRRNFWTGTLASALGFGLFFGNVVILPLWLQQYMGYTAIQAGMVLAPVGLLAIVLAPLVGMTVDRVDARIYVSLSFLVFALVFWMRSLFTTDADFATIMVPTIIQGAATAGFFIPLVAIALFGLPPERMAGATGLFNFVRLMAGAVGTSISTTLWEDRSTLHHAQLTEAINLGSNTAVQALAGLQDLGFTHQQALGVIDQIITRQAFMISTQEVFYASALLFLVLVVFVWLARKPDRHEAGAGSAH